MRQVVACYNASMSNFIHCARNPKTGEIENAAFLDDYFGKHAYGVRFSDGSVYPESEIEIINTVLQ